MSTLPDFEWDFFEWSQVSEVNRFFYNYQNYDAVISNGVISKPENLVVGSQFENTLGDDFFKKLICVSWAEPKLEGGHFNELIGENKNILWAAPTEKIKNKLWDHYRIEAEMVAAGVDPNIFKPSRDIKQITTLGISGTPGSIHGWDLIKRPEMMIEIAQRAGINHHFINGKPNSLGTSLYDEIDMYICTSTTEAGPYGIAECAFSKIPVLSTPVGYASKFKSVKTFETVHEAVAIIQELNADPQKLKDYIEEVYEEFTNNLTWDRVGEEYWKPLIQKRINLNKS